MSAETGDDRTLADETDVEYPLWYVVRRVGRPHLPWFVAGVVLAMVTAIIGNTTVLFIGFAFDSVFGGQPLALPLVPQTWIPERATGQLWFMAGLLVLSGTLGVVTNVAKQGVWELFAHRVVDDVRVETFDSAQRQRLSFYDRYQTGDLMTALNGDVNRLEHVLSKSARWTVESVTNILSALGFMLYLNWQLTLVVALMVPILSALNWWFSTKLEAYYDPVREAGGRLNARMETSLSGINVVKANVAEPFERERFAEGSADFRDKQWAAERFQIRQEPLVMSVTGAALVVTMILGGIWVLDGPPPVFTGTLTAGQLIPFLFYMRDLEGPVEFTTAIIGMYKMGKASAKRVVGVRNADEHLDEDDAGDTEIADVTGAVEYDGVSFSYPGADEEVLDGVSLGVDAGETVGVVGSTGAGKSTLVKLLLRFYSPGEGTVRLDAHDVQTLSRERLRAAIGYVDQDPFLFDGTVRENVAYGAEDVTDDEIVAVAKEAGAHEFVTHLSDGYDTQVGQRGVKLSGGQRQRIAIARAIVGDPPVLVFDEATSHVDNETELLIQQNLDRLTADRTTFVIAHRLSTVRDADEVLVLDDGELVERGTHDELLGESGTYANLWHVQVGEREKLPDEFVERVTADEG